MNRNIIVLAAAGVLLVAGCQGGGEAGKSAKQTQGPDLSTESARLSYAIGLDVGRSLKNLNAEIDVAAFSAAVRDRLEGRQPRIAEQEAAKIKQTFFQARAKRQAEERSKQAKANLEASKKFLAENAKRPGVKVTPSGLQYEVVRMGKGPKPEATDRVTVHYRGTLIDGTEFDSSYKRGQPATFPLNGVIKGWTEGLQLMPVGSKFKLYLPPELAYGERGAGGRIGPNQALIFEVELLGIEGKAPASGGKNGAGKS